MLTKKDVGKLIKMYENKLNKKTKWKFKDMVGDYMFISKELNPHTTALISTFKDKGQAHIEYGISGRGYSKKKIYYNANFSWDGKKISDFKVEVDKLVDSPYSKMKIEMTKENIESLVKEAVIEDLSKKILKLKGYPEVLKNE